MKHLWNETARQYLLTASDSTIKEWENWSKKNMKLSARCATEWYIKRSIPADSLDYTQAFFKPVLAKSNGGSVNSLMYDSFD